MCFYKRGKYIRKKRLGSMLNIESYVYINVDVLNIIDIYLYIMCKIFVGVFLSRNCEYDSAIAVFLSDALKSQV